MKGLIQCRHSQCRQSGSPRHLAAGHRCFGAASCGSDRFDHEQWNLLVLFDTEQKGEPTTSRMEGFVAVMRARKKERENTTGRDTAAEERRRSSLLQSSRQQQPSSAPLLLLCCRSSPRAADSAQPAYPRGPWPPAAAAAANNHERQAARSAAARRLQHALTTAAPPIQTYCRGPQR